MYLFCFQDVIFLKTATIKTRALSALPIKPFSIQMAEPLEVTIMAVSSAIVHRDTFNCSTESAGLLHCRSCRQSKKMDEYKHILCGFFWGYTKIGSTRMMWWSTAGYFEPARDVGGTLQKIQIKWNRFFSLESLTSMLLEHVLIQFHCKLEFIYQHRLVCQDASVPEETKWSVLKPSAPW